MADAAITADAGMHRADRGEQELGVGVLEQEPARALPDRARRGLVEVEGREHHDARRIAASRSSSAVAARPSITGIRMSISTTSGRAARTTSTRLAPVGRLGDDLEVGLRVDEHADAGAEQRLVVDERDADRRSRRDRRGRLQCALRMRGQPARTTNRVLVGAAVERPADELRALAHADEPVPGDRRAPSAWHSAQRRVRTSSSTRRRCHGEPHDDRPAVAVAEGVGERLLQDPVHRELRGRGRLRGRRRVDVDRRSTPGARTCA